MLVRWALGGHVYLRVLRESVMREEEVQGRNPEVVKERR